MAAMSGKPDNPRSQYREQVRSQLLSHAWEELAVSGADGLSLKAVAGRLGVTAPALYRYIRTRDELLDQLVADARADLTARIQAAGSSRCDPVGRLVDVAVQLRAWAVELPARYLLVHTRVTESAGGDGTILTALAALYDQPDPRGGHASRRPRPAAPRPALVAEPDESAQHRALAFWTRLHGVLALELTGWFHATGVDAEQHYEREVTAALLPVDID